MLPSMGMRMIQNAALSFIGISAGGVIAAGVFAFLVIIGVFSMALCALQIVRSSLQGMGEALVPMAGGVLELAARWGGCALLLPFGYAGICFSTPLAWLLALTLLCLYYKKSREES